MTKEYLPLVKERYDDFERECLKYNKILGKETPLGYWGVTPLDSLFTLFSKLNMNKEHSFVDLGSGDGRVVLTASLFTKRSVGVEVDTKLIIAALNIKNELLHMTTDQNLPIHERAMAKNPFKFANIVEDDFMNHDLSFYDFVYISPDKPFYRGDIENKLQKELKGILIVQSMEFAPQTLELVDEQVIDHTRFRMYRNPNM